MNCDDGLHNHRPRLPHRLFLLQWFHPLRLNSSKSPSQIPSPLRQALIERSNLGIVLKSPAEIRYRCSFAMLSSPSLFLSQLATQIAFALASSKTMFSLVSAALASNRVDKYLEVKTGCKKEAWSRLLLVPRLEAPELPCLSKRATPKAPRRCYIYLPLPPSVTLSKQHRGCRPRADRECI